MRIGVIGHTRTIQIVCSLIRQNHPDIDAIPCILDSMDLSSAISFIKTSEDQFDGLLFTGRIPYDLVNTAIFSHKPWAYIDRDNDQLLHCLLQASQIQNRDIRRISLDSYEEAQVQALYSSIGYVAEELDLRVFKGDIFSETFLQDLTLFHAENAAGGGSSLCITGVSSVYEELSRRDLPCMILDPTPASLQTALNLLSEKERSRLMESSQMVVLSIERDLPNDYALVRENEYLLALETMKITEEVYLFAQRIQAAVVERESGRFLLFTTRNLFEFETGNLKRLSLLTPQSGLRFGTLSIGIGYGETAREAKYNAGLGLLRAKKNGGSQAYKVENNSYWGPIQPDKGDAPGSAGTPQIDGHFQEVADAAGISLNTILKLQWIMDREQTDSFTALELSRLFGISLRSMHRLLEKLAGAGFVRIVGRNVRSAKGRPSRVVQLVLTGGRRNGRS